MIKLILFFLALINAHAGTLLSNTGAAFSGDKIKVSVASNSVCNNADVTKYEIIDMIQVSIRDYWNTVPTSSLKLINGKEFSTTDSSFQSGVLCSDQSLNTKCTGLSNPLTKVEGILISCNDNVTNYSSNGLNANEVLAITLPNNLRGSTFLGSMIIINDTPSSPFKSLTYDEKVAVIAHEIGHAIGLGHSENDGNIMFWTPTPKRFALGPDDADAVTYLYPKKFDGCGMAGTINDEQSGDKNHLWWQTILSFLFSLGFFIVIQKLFFKLKVSIF